MKRPSKKPQIIRKQSDLVTSWTPYKPEDLEDVAKKMRDRNIDYIEFGEEGYGDSYFVCYEVSTETPDQVEKRYKKELAEYNKFKQQQKDRKLKQLKQLAKELGVEIK